MEQEELQELFCAKIALEYGRFRCDVLAGSPEEIYGKAYQIDSVINIYEQLLEMSQQMEKRVVVKLLLFPHLLTFLYMEWLKKEDSLETELNGFLRTNISKILQTETEKQNIAEEECTL